MGGTIRAGQKQFDCDELRTGHEHLLFNRAIERRWWVPRQNRQRVAPPGSTVCNAVALCGLSRYTNHGGGPADGALNSAVSARPVSSTWAGQPSAAQSAAMAATVGGSVTGRALPSTTRSNSSVATLSAQRGSRSRFLALRFRSPDWNQKEPSTNDAPTPVTCGLPSGLIVVSQHVCRFGPPVPGPWLMPDSSRAWMGGPLEWRQVVEVGQVGYVHDRRRYARRVPPEWLWRRTDWHGRDVGL